MAVTRPAASGTRRTAHLAPLPKAEEKHDGLFGLGFGPDIGLGLTDTIGQIGGGVLGLARLAGHGGNMLVDTLTPGHLNPIPGTQGADFSDAGKGIATSFTGSLATPLTRIVDPIVRALPGDAPLPGQLLESLPAHAFGEDYRAKDLFERIGEHGLIPGVVEDVGNAALFAGAVTAPLKAAGAGARAVGAEATAARLAETVARIDSNPIIAGMKHPYQAAGRAVESKLLAPALERVEDGQNLLRPASDIGSDITPAPETLLSDADNPMSQATGDVRIGDQTLARGERFLQGRRTGKIIKQEERLASAERLQGAHDPAILGQIEAGQELLRTAHETRTPLTRQAADDMIGSEVRQRLSYQPVADLIHEAGAPESVLAESGTRPSVIPEALRTPELEAAIQRAVTAYPEFKAKITETLDKSTRHDPIQDAPLVTPTKAETRIMRQIDKNLERADSDVLDRKITRERTREQVRLDTATRKLDQIDSEIQGIPGDQAAAAEAFQGTRTGEAPLGRTLRQEAATTPKIPAQTAGDKMRLYRAGRTAERSIVRIEQGAQRRVELAKLRTRVTKQVADIQHILETGTASQVERSGLLSQADTLGTKLREGLETPSMARAAARWQPMMKAVQDIASEAHKYPGLEDVLADLIGEDGKPVLGKIRDLAIERGFNPQHISDFSPGQVRRLVYSNMSLGPLTEVAEAGARKSRTGALAKAGGVDQSIAAFASAMADTVREYRANRVIDAVQNQFTRVIPKGSVIPDDVRSWDGMKRHILTGTELDDTGFKRNQVATSDTEVVPKQVYNSLRSYTQDFNHAAFRTLGKITSPWRTLMLTLSPVWYEHNIVGNIILASAQGAHLRDWVSAWHEYRQADELGHWASLPHLTNNALAHESGVLNDATMIPRPSSSMTLPGTDLGLPVPGREGLRQAALEARPNIPGPVGTAAGAVRGGAQEVRRHLVRANEVVDEMARAAVYKKGRRMNLSHEDAIHMSTEAMVDYNNLSPFERTVVRSVVPFYSWQKGILKVTAQMAIDHPARIGLLMQLGKMNQEYAADLFGVQAGQVPEAYDQMLGSFNARPWNPFADSAALLSPEGITRSMNPFIELGLRKGLGAPEFFPESYRMGYFGQREPDVNVASELGGMLTGSGPGRLFGFNGGNTDWRTRLVQNSGLRSADVAKIRTRLQRTAGQLGNGQAPLLPG